MAREHKPVHKITSVVAISALLTLGIGYEPQAAASGRSWVASWAASPVVGTDVPGFTCPAGKGLHDQTVRNVVFAGTGGRTVRVRLTNVFGTQRMRIGQASVALQASGSAAVRGSVRPLTFRGARSVNIPAGAQMFSDPVALDVPALSTLLVSVHVPDRTGPITYHPFTAQGNYLSDGNRADAVTGDFQDTPCWMFVDGVDVVPAKRVTGSVVAFGDSITDTANTTGNANRRWPDFLARRLNEVRGPTLSVVNAGLGGNRLLADREGQPYYGIAGLSRLDRDVFAQTNVRVMILLEGINDIGYDATAGQLIAGYREVIRRAHARGVRVIGATLPPFKGSVIWTAGRQATWDAVNTWIRTSGAFDGVADFAAATAAPGDPLTLNPAHDSGDRLHPNDQGTKAMADAVDLRCLSHKDAVVSLGM